MRDRLRSDAACAGCGSELSSVCICTGPAAHGPRRHASSLRGSSQAIYEGMIIRWWASLLLLLRSHDIPPHGTLILGLRRIVVWVLILVGLRQYSHQYDV